VNLALRTSWLGRELVHLASTASTNDVALARARAGAAPGLVVIADEQSQGRGRQGRSWHSPAAGNLYLSAVVKPPASPGLAPPLTLAAGIAVCDALNSLGCGASIKWPNDVLISGKKVAGILTETATRGERLEAVVIGVGVNVNGTSLPPELAPIATSVRLALGRAVDRDALAAELLGRLELWLDCHEAEGAAAIARAWKERSMVIGRRVNVVVDGHPLAGDAVDLDGEGALLVDVPSRGVVRVVAGEVTIA
jgi:BirA family transcriptional regulator, biotin operon repressor / biotin---[acetyl-CoA-carboxylase] ligase